MIEEMFVVSENYIGILYIHIGENSKFLSVKENKNIYLKNYTL